MIEPPHCERGLDQVQVPLRRAHTLNVKVAKEFRSNQKLFPAFRRHRAHRPGAARSWRRWSSGTAAWLGHRSITSTADYTALAPNRLIGGI